MTTSTLTPKQDFIADSAVKWFRDSSDQVFAYCGFAGTGKTFIIHEIIERINQSGIKVDYDDIAFCAYTGKASLVMTTKSGGKFTASTIHRLCYELDVEGNGSPQFVLRDKKQLQEKYKLIVVDEASMVDGDIEEDLKSFGIKIIAIGDLGQLEPIQNSKGRRGTLLDNPIAEMTEIHRQAEGNPIIHLSMLAREGRRIEPGKYGDSVVVMRKNDLSHQQKVALYQRADQVICGYNKTRQTINNQVRQALGYQTDLPVIGDKLICVKNNWNIELNDINLINGLTGYVREVTTEVPKDSTIKHEALKVNFQPDFMTENDVFKDLVLLQGDFKNEKIQLEREEYNIYDRFDFGYGVTCHKSQGSSWENVVLFNEVLNSETHHRWLYTGITRAEQRLILFV